MKTKTRAGHIVSSDSEVYVITRSGVDNGNPESDHIGRQASFRHARVDASPAVGLYNFRSPYQVPLTLTGNEIRIGNIHHG